VLHGNCLVVMPTLEAESVDAIVTDPPYGLAFMGKDWDHGVPGVHFWAEALRVAKPGAFLLAFGGTRTFHRLTCAIEDAGWEIRDCLMWLYGSGFPKSLDVSKAMDKAAGAERVDAGPMQSVPNHNLPGTGARFRNPSELDGARISVPITTAPATDLARQWDGWGTALKPAWEPIILARKPLVGTVAANVARYGTGAINVDGCRITAGRDSHDLRVTQGGVDCGVPLAPRGAAPRAFQQNDAGRWPANVVLDEEAARLLDEQSGSVGGAAPASGPTHAGPSGRGSMAGAFGGMGKRAPAFYGAADGASRFFYTSKASRSEREAGLGGGPRKDKLWSSGTQNPGSFQAAGTDRSSTNHHPTVKPLALMRWLCRLVTPPGGLILDPFCGSGSTGCAAVLEGFRFLGIEREAEYVELARRRIAHAETLYEPGLFPDLST
jgi:site-specific DNA-methyltransferase (adenine-specific)